MKIPGVDWLVAAVLIAEIGVDMSVFLSAYHLAAWAGVCPGNHESAGKQSAR
jgi:transposase